MFEPISIELATDGQLQQEIDFCLDILSWSDTSVKHKLYYSLRLAKANNELERRFLFI